MTGSALSPNPTFFAVLLKCRAGTFDVRYVDPQAALKAERDKEGFFGKLFGHKNQTVKPENLRISVQAAGSGSQVSVKSLDGGSDAAASESNILHILQQQLQ